MTQLVIIFVLLSLLSLGTAFSVEYLLRNKQPRYRESEVGRSLQGHPIIRGLYDAIGLVFWVNQSIAVALSEFNILLLGIWGGLFLVGWDMFLCFITFKLEKIKNKIVENYKESLEEMDDEHTSAE